MAAYDSLQLLSGPQDISYFEQSQEFQHHLQNYTKRFDTEAKQPETQITGPEALVEFYHLVTRFRVLGSLVIEPYDAATKRPVLLGQGGQFAVYKGYRWDPDHDGKAGNGDEGYLDAYWQPVALKRPFFDRYTKRTEVSETRTGRAKLVDVEDRKVQQSIKNMAHEILALQHPGLIGHPYIVQLTGWSSFGIKGCIAPCLVLPLARSDLRQHLESHPELSHEERLSYCKGLASAVDSLHQCGIIHGDLKFENVLVFLEEGTRFVPKISDFGFSITSMEQDQGFVDQISGTPGWIAPEVKECIEHGKRIPTDELHKADNYSFGLLVERTMAYGGFRCPPEVADLVNQVTTALTADNPRDRPSLLGNLLNSPDIVVDGSEENITFDNGHKRMVYPPLASDYDADDAEVVLTHAHPGSAYEVSLLSLFRHDPGRVPNHTLFGLVLFRPDLETDLLLSMLTAAAGRGHKISQAVVTIVHRHFGKTVLAETASITNWLRSAVESGSWLAARELSRRAPELLPPAQTEFRRRGGYTSDRRYQIKNLDPAVTLETLPAQNRVLSLHQDTSLHLLSSMPPGPAFEKCLSNLDGCVSINHQNAFGETALSRACMAGQTANTLALLSNGADPSLVLYEADGRVSCLHWLFVFPIQDQKAVAQALLDAGADINAVASKQTVILHYPFWLPYGTPLHWAVYTSSLETCKVLLELGADLGVRDGSDPYQHEENVRIDARWEHYLSKLPETQGFNVLDLAVSLHYAEFVEYLNKECRTQCRRLLDDRDEEGFTPFHRFHAGRISEILNIGADVLHIINETNKFSTATFSSPPGSPERRGELRRCIHALIDLGFDVNSITSPQEARKSGNIFCCTPLMLAVMELDLDMVSILLSTPQQDVRTTLPNGGNHLFVLRNIDPEPEFGPYPQGSTIQYIIQSLLAAGVDIHHKDNYGTTAIGHAANARNIPIITALASHGARVTDKITFPRAGVRQGDTALVSVLEELCYRFTLATEASVLQFVERFVPDARAAADHLRSDGETLLHLAATGGSVPITRMLLEMGLDPAAKRKERRAHKKREWTTPLDDLRDKVENGRSQNVYYVDSADAVLEAERKRFEETEALLLGALMKQVEFR